MKNYLLPSSARNLRRTFSLLAVSGAILLAPTLARADLISNVILGPSNAPYAYGLTIEFNNGNYYDFTLRSVTAAYTGYDFINAVATLSQGTLAPMSVTQVNASFGHYISAISVANDTNSGFANSNYWAYWNSVTANPPQWSYSNVGEDGRTITPGQADGWVYGANGGNQPPQANAFPAVPEPGTWACLAAFGAGCIVIRISRRRATV